MTLEKTLSRVWRPIRGVRTVRNGRVRLHGRTWKPDERHAIYDGRLDGQRFFFIEYRDPVEPLVALWGSEAEYREEPNPVSPQVVEGTLPWYFWKVVPEKQT